MLVTDQILRDLPTSNQQDPDAYGGHPTITASILIAIDIDARIAATFELESCEQPFVAE